MTYESFVSRERIRITFILAELNDCESIADDTGNAYLYAKNKQKIYYRAGLEWGPTMKGQVCVIVRAIYGLIQHMQYINTVRNDVMQCTVYLVYGCVYMMESFIYYIFQYAIPRTSYNIVLLYEQ